MPVIALAFVGLDVIIVALALFLVFYAGKQLIEGPFIGLAGLIDTLPPPINAAAQLIRASVNYIVGKAQEWISGEIQAGTQPIVEAMNTTATNMRADAYSVRQTHIAVINQVNRNTDALRGPNGRTTMLDIAIAVGNAEQRADAYTQLIYDASTTYAASLYDQAVTWTEGAIQNVGAILDQTRTDLITTTGQLTDTINGVREEAFAAISASAVETLATADEHGARVAAALGDAITQEQADRGIGDAAVRDGAEQRLHEVTDPLVAGQSAITAYLGATVATFIADTRTWRNDCGDPLCTGLLGFAKGLNSFINAGELGALLALIVGAAVAGESGADTIEATLGGFIDAPRAVFDGLVGNIGG